MYIYIKLHESKLKRLESYLGKRWLIKMDLTLNCWHKLKLLNVLLREKQFEMKTLISYLWLFILYTRWYSCLCWASRPSSFISSTHPGKTVLPPNWRFSLMMKTQAAYYARVRCWWMVCLFVLSRAAIDVLSHSSEGVEQCKEWSSNMTQQIDLAFNIFFMVYFFIRVSGQGEAADENQSSIEWFVIYFNCFLFEVYRG